MDCCIGHGSSATHVEVEGVAGERRGEKRGSRQVAGRGIPAAHPPNWKPREVGDDAAAVAKGKGSRCRRTRSVGSAASGRRVVL